MMILFLCLHIQLSAVTHSFFSFSTIPCGQEQPGLQVSGFLHIFLHDNVEHVKSQALLQLLNTFPFLQSSTIIKFF